MATIYLTGGQSKYINEHRAKKIHEWKKNGDKDMQGKLVDIGESDFIELRQIRRIRFDTNAPVDPRVRISNDRILETQKWEKEQKEWESRTPEEKAERMVRSGCLLRYTVKMNKLPMPSALIEALLPRLISYFTDNPTETWAMAKVYDDIIPQGEIKVKTSVGNFKSLGQAMTEPRNPNQMVNVICDQCGVKFQLEEAVAQFPTEERFCARCSSEQKKPEKNPVQTKVNLGL